MSDSESSQSSISIKKKSKVSVSSESVHAPVPIAAPAKNGSSKKSCPAYLVYLLGVLALGFLIGLIVVATKKDEELAAVTTSQKWADWPEFKTKIYSKTDEVAFVASILAGLTLEEKVAQMIQPALNSSKANESGTVSLGPADQATYKFGSWLNGGGGWMESTMNYNGFPTCPGCIGVKSEPASYARFMEELHIANDSAWVAAGKPRIPFMYATDAVHGHNNLRSATIYPHNIGLGCANDADLIERIGRATAREVTTTAMDWTFAPTVATPRDLRWGRTYEGYSEDSEITYSYAKAMVKGVQGGTPELLAGHDHVLANAKHFIGDGGTLNGVDRGVCYYSEEDLLNIHGGGYMGAMEEDVQIVMVSFNSWDNHKNVDFNREDGVDYNFKLHGSHYIMTDVLKGKMGFNGLIVTDWLGHMEISGCSKDKCRQVVTSGADIIMLPESMLWKVFMDDIVAGVNSGDVPLSRIDDAVTRILAVKYRAGLFQKASPLGVACNKYDVTSVNGVPKFECVEKCNLNDGVSENWTVTHPDTSSPCGRANAGSLKLLQLDETKKLAREAVSKSLVLLKNKGNVLPIPSGKSVGYIGVDGYKNYAMYMGGWSLSWQGGNDKLVNASKDDPDTDFPEAEHIVNILNEFGATEGCDNVEVCIALVGEDPYAEMLGDIPRASSLDYSTLKPHYYDAVEAVWGIPSTTKVVTIFFSGRPLYTNDLLVRSDSFVAAWLPGAQARGITDLIFQSGGKDFTGKLSFTWPTSKCHATLHRPPAFLNQGCAELNCWDTPVWEVDYQDASAKEYAPFPYGYGLTYKSDAAASDGIALKEDGRVHGCGVASPTPENLAHLDKTFVFPSKDVPDVKCSVYKDQFSNQTMQQPCSKFNLDCVDNPDTCSESGLMSFAVSETDSPIYSFKTIRAAEGHTYRNSYKQFFLTGSKLIDMTGFYFNDNPIYSIKVKVNSIGENHACTSFGIGIVFTALDRAFEMSDRMYVEIGDMLKEVNDEGNLPESNIFRTICVNAHHFNPPEKGIRNWWDVANPFVFGTRCAFDVEIQEISALEAPLDSCDYYNVAPTTYNSYEKWVSKSSEIA